MYALMLALILKEDPQLDHTHERRKKDEMRDEIYIYTYMSVILQQFISNNLSTRRVA